MIKIVTILTGIGSYVYFKRESSFANSEAMGNGSSNKHIPFNKMAGFIPPKPKYKEKVIYLFHSNEPAIIYNEFLEPGNAEIITYYKDPFLLLTLFSQKTINTDSAWTGTADNILADFTAMTERDSIAIQYKIKDRDSTAHIERTLKGGKVIKYRWVIAKGSPLMEHATIKMVTFADASQAPDIDNGFDGGEFDTSGVDGGFSDWDGEEGDVIHAKDISLTLGGVALAGLSVETFELTIDVNSIYDHLQDSYNAQIEYDSTRVFRCEVTGYFKTKAHLEEAEKAYASKTLSTLKISHASGDKWIQFTNAYVVSDDYDDERIPKSGEALKARFVWQGGVGTAMSYSWTGSEANDPSNHITHDN